MTREMRNNLTPQDYIRQMFRETQDGKLSITYDPFIGETETCTYQVNWSGDDAEMIVRKYDLLTSALARIGRIHDKLEDEESRNDLLSEGDLHVWNTYVKPYEPMVVDWDLLYPIPPCEPDELMSLIREIHERAQFGDLIEEEEELWKQCCMWREEQSQKRIPFNRRSAANMIFRARRYEKLISLHAPEIVVTKEGRYLAEEMVLYYADKVRTISMSETGEEYISHIRFAIFERDGIDLEALITSDPLLNSHRDAFTLLPALAETEISSTAVRKRFYAGEDCSDLIPAAAVDVLMRHDPSEFTTSFPERMQIIMKDGRFGMRKAGREVYQANAEIFRAWKDGKADINFGDRQAFLNNTKLYTRPFSVADQGTVFVSTETGCINADCVDVAQYLMEQGYDPAILNLASAKSPGGGYHEGYAAQEESLCHSSNLCLSLYQYGNPKFKHIRESGVPTKTPGYPLDRDFGGIYTPDVTFFRNSRAKFFALRDTVFSCDVITVAALSFNGRTQFSGVEEITFRAADGGFTPEGEAIMLNKIRTIFRMGVEHGKDALVLGAFGCGAYKLPSQAVAAQFRQVMNEPEFFGKFRLLVFAILESTRKPNGLNGNFAPFYHEFGTYHI